MTVELEGKIGPKRNVKVELITITCCVSYLELREIIPGITRGCYEVQVTKPRSVIRTSKCPTCYTVYCTVPGYWYLCIKCLVLITLKFLEQERVNGTNKCQLNMNLGEKKEILCITQFLTNAFSSSSIISKFLPFGSHHRAEVTPSSVQQCQGLNPGCLRIRGAPSSLYSLSRFPSIYKFYFCQSHH